MLNPAGYYTLPTASNVAVALTAAKIRGVDDNTPAERPGLPAAEPRRRLHEHGPRAYPLSSYSYLIVPRQNAPLPVPPRFDTTKGGALSRYIAYILCAGQGEADGLGYSPIPRNLVRGGMLQVNHIPGANSGVDPNKLNNCPNPTFNSKGQLTVLTSAPMPSPCDKLGAPLNCTNGGNSGGSAGSSGGAGGTGSSGGASGGSATGGGSGGTTIDPQTGLPVSSGGAGGTDTALAGSVVTIGGRHDDWLMATLTTLELLAVVAVPPVLGGWLLRARRATATGGPPKRS